MIKRYTSNIYVDFYIHAAKKLKILYKIIPGYKTTLFLEINNKFLFISNAVLGINNNLSVKLTSNKYTSYQLFDMKDIPHPKGILITSIKNLPDKIKILKKPLVVKPIKGSGGHGVTVKLNNIKNIKKAIKGAKKINKSIIIEEYIEGTNFRILIYKNQILDIVKRIPANVIGNNKNSIQQLINKKNEKREKVGLKKIKIDNELNKELKNHTLTLKSIIPKKKTLFLRRNCNMATGGETTRVSLKNVHKDNLKLFIKSANLVNLDFAGIDFITKDISKSYKDNNSIINEINRFPSLDVHYFADMKMDNSVAEKLLSMYFNF